MSGQATSEIVPPILDEAVLRQVPADAGDLVARWRARATFHSMQVRAVAADTAAIAAGLDAVLAGHVVRRCLLNAHEQEARWNLPAYLAGRGVELLAWGAPDCAREAYGCELAITDCRAAVADTGGVLVWSDAGFGRSSTLVIPIHVVLLPVERILPDLIDALALVQESGGQLPSNVVLINGPLKTADIEMNLITGVHGPKHLIVLLIE